MLATLSSGVAIKAADEPREGGVGFAIRTVLIAKLETLPKGFNDRLMSMRIPLACNTHLTLISAPTMTYPEEDKEPFYQSLDTLHSAPRNDKLLLMGDFSELGSMAHRHESPWPGARKCKRTSAADSLFRGGPHHHKHPLQATRNPQGHLEFFCFSRPSGL